MVKLRNQVILNNSESEDEEESSSPKVKVFESVIAKQYDVRFDKSIGSDITEYFHYLNLLEVQAGEKDIINVRMANYGGDLHTGIALAHAMKNCKSTVIVHANSHCASMAAILALCGDALFLYPGNHLMFHNYSGGELGKAGEIETSHKATRRAWKEYLHYFCTPFLTDEDIKVIMDDKDKYYDMKTAGIKARLKRHFPNWVQK